MITLNANTDNEIIFFLEPELENPYYLFVFSKLQGCDELAEILFDESDCEEYQQFNVNVNLRSGIYNLSIYEQSDYTNLNPDLSHFLDEIKVKMVNICDQCDNVLAATNEFYITTTDDEFILIDKDCI